MASLEDIPKYAFGTSHLIDNNPKNRNDNEEDDDGDDEADEQSDHNQLPRISESNFRRLVLRAIRRGCRHFDCAPMYGTQHLVGQCLRKATMQVPRQHLFVTSKLPPNMMRTEHISRSILKSIDELRCSYLDLFLIHAPFATKYRADDDYYPVDESGNLLMDEDDYLLENAWRKMVELKQRGLTRYIGLSNVNMEQLIRLNAIHPVDVVQNEYHMYNQNRDLFDFCEEINVHFEAYACFGNPPLSKRDSKPNCMFEPAVHRVAYYNSISVAQTIIQWIHYQPLSYVIKCDNKRQLDENLEAIKSAYVPVNDLIELDTLDKKCRIHTFAEHKGLINHREYPFKELGYEDLQQVLAQVMSLNEQQRQIDDRNRQVQLNAVLNQDAHYSRQFENLTLSHNNDKSNCSNDNNNNNNEFDDDDDDDDDDDETDLAGRLSTSNRNAPGSSTSNETASSTGTFKSDCLAQVSANSLPTPSSVSSPSSTDRISPGSSHSIAN